MPLALVAVDNPMVLIPAAASESFLNNLTVLVLTNLTTYSSPLTKVPVEVLSPATPIETGSFPF